MPTYSFLCPRCGTYDRVLPMSRVSEEDVCDCGKAAKRDRKAEIASGALDCNNRDYAFYGEHGTRLHGATYLPQSADRAHREHPDTEFVLHNSALYPVIKNRAHKLRYLKEMGNWVEYD